MSLKKLFRRFWRGDNSRHSEGQGLGLSLVKAIAELHGEVLRITILISIMCSELRYRKEINIGLQYAINQP